jgi:hypothetical protein
MLSEILWCVLPVSARHYSQVLGSSNMHVHGHSGLTCLISVNLEGFIPITCDQVSM